MVVYIAIMRFANRCGWLDVFETKTLSKGIGGFSSQQDIYQGG
jgi:hypothetical protein